jgi:hypothetical protein
MTLTVQVIYGADRSTSRIDSVPPTTPLLILKQMLAKINQMATPDSIRLVQRGVILDDDQLLSSLSLSGNSLVTIYATGIPTKVQPGRAAHGTVTGRPSAKTFVKRHKVLIGVAGLIAIFGAVVLLALADVLPMPAVRLSESSSSRWPLSIALASVGGLIALCLWKLGPNQCLDIVKLYATTALPMFDVEAFKREHNIG